MNKKSIFGSIVLCVVIMSSVFVFDMVSLTRDGYELAAWMLIYSIPVLFVLLISLLVIYYLSSKKHYVKVMFGTKGADYEYKIGEVNVANVWNPSATSGKDFGGFNFSNEKCILRWLARGDTIYDVTIPKGAEVIDVVDSATPHGVFRSNKIIISNPRKVTDDMAMEFYKKSDIPEIAYYNAMGGCAVMGYDKTARQIFKDKVNQKTCKTAWEEWDSYISKHDRRDSNDIVKYIDNELKKMNKII